VIDAILIDRDARARWLGRFLLVCGVANIAVHPIVPWLAPELFFWHPRDLAYELMIGGIYGALGIAMIVASRRPLQHKLFVDASILVNAFHAGVMAYFGVTQKAWAHFYGDIPWIAFLAVFPLAVYPWGRTSFLRTISTGGEP
jgi:hypothetical protein